MSATEFGLGLLYIAVAVICYAAGWWQGKTVERDGEEERAAAQDQLVQRDQRDQEPGVLVRRHPSSAVVDSRGPWHGPEPGWKSAAEAHRQAAWAPGLPIVEEKAALPRFGDEQTVLPAQTLTETARP